MLSQINKKRRLYFNQLSDVLEKVNKKTNKNKILTFIDIIYSTLYYKSSPTNYYDYDFYNNKSDVRNTYMTYGLSKRLIDKYNNNSDLKDIDDKLIFERWFKDYYGRQFLDFKNSNFNNFVDFIQNKEYIICKPTNEGQGRGVFKLKVSDFENERELYDYISKSELNCGIIDEFIVQHDRLKELYEGSVNTIRVVTIIENSKCNILFASIRIGNGKNTDNFSDCGITSPIDIVTGVITHNGLDRNYNVYMHHPISKQAILGFQIPMWNEVIDIVNEASAKISKNAYIGWDVAITNKGPILIEANMSPGYTVPQKPIHLFEGHGIKKEFERFL